MTYLDPIRDALAKQLPGLHPDLLDLYTLLAVTQRFAVDCEDVHDAWVLWTQRRRPDHRDLIPYAELDPERQELDKVYVEAIHAVVKDVIVG